MKTLFKGSALALPLLLCALPAAAEEALPEEIVAIGLRPDAHGPAGTMGDHVHKSGDLMLGVMWMHEAYGGADRSGTPAPPPSGVAAAGYTPNAPATTKDMAMFHIMWAPNDRFTLMVVPQWMRMGMTMEGLPAPMGGMGGMGGMTGMTGMAPGQTMTHASEGLGDTQFGALVSLSRRPRLSVHAGLMVSAPTGTVTRRKASGKFEHYMMQAGSGTWDLNPSLTLHGMTEHFGWGAQVSGLFRAEKANKVGFRFGDRFTATAWASTPLTRRLSLSTRLQWSSEGTIKGEYNGPHGTASPPDGTGNYGGERLEGSLGANLIVGDRVRIGAEASLPLYQKVNGIQLPKQVGINLNAAMMF